MGVRRGAAVAANAALSAPMIGIAPFCTGGRLVRCPSPEHDSQQPLMATECTHRAVSSRKRHQHLASRRSPPPLSASSDAISAGDSGGGFAGGSGRGGSGDGRGGSDDAGGDGGSSESFLLRGWRDRVAEDPSFPFKVLVEQARAIHHSLEMNCQRLLCLLTRMLCAADNWRRGSSAR